MDLRNGIRSSEFLKNHSDELLDFVNKTRKTIVITKNDKAKAVIQDIASYEELRKAFLLLKFISQGERDFREGKVVSHEEVKNQMNEKIKNLRADRSRSILPQFIERTRFEIIECAALFTPAALSLFSGT